MADKIDWRPVLLEELAASSRNAIVGGPFGSDLVSSDYSTTGIPVIRGENVSLGRWVGGEFVFVPPAKAQQLSANTAGPLDIVFTQRGANHYKQVAVVPREANGRFVISQSQMKVTLDLDKADPLFVYYLFRAPQQQQYLQQNAIQTGVPHTNLSILRRTPLHIPRLPLQRAIVQVLGALDDKIELNYRVNDMLEAMARAFFKDWFVDFGPTRAKIEGRPAYLAPDIWALFPSKLDHQEKPEGWRFAALGEFFKLERGLSYKGEFLTHEGIPMVNLGCFIGDGRFDAKKVKPYSGEFRERHRVKPGDMVLANTDMTQKRVVLGSPHVISVDDGDDLIFSHHVYAARPLNPEARQWTRFFYHHLLQPDFRERAEGFATGTTVLFLPSDAAEKCSFVLPSAKANDAFLAMIDPITAVCRSNARENETLVTIRDGLLPKLMSGEIRIKEAVKVIEAAL